MTDEISKLLYGALGGGIAALLIKLADAYFIGFRLNESILAKKKFWQYSKILWFDCHELQQRLKHIETKILNNDIDPLKFKLTKDLPLDWYTKNGYYATSTAYLISSVSSWIQLFQRDVVFLDFGKKNLTANFFKIIENLKIAFSSNDSILWYHYLNGVGDILIDEQQKTPLSFSDFTIKLHKDEDFRLYFEQLFYFLDNVVTKKQTELLERIIVCIDETLEYLAKNSVIPKKQKIKIFLLSFPAISVSRMKISG